MHRKKLGSIKLSGYEALTIYGWPLRRTWAHFEALCKILKMSFVGGRWQCLTTNEEVEKWGEVELIKIVEIIRDATDENASWNGNDVFLLFQEIVRLNCAPRLLRRAKRFRDFHAAKSKGCTHGKDVG